MNVPPDAQWLWRFDTRSNWQRLQRSIQTRKFHATLKHRLDTAVQIWHATQPDDTPEPIYREHPGGGPLGGPISIHSPWSDERQTDTAD